MPIQYLSSQILLIVTITTFTLLTTFAPHIAKQGSELSCFGFYTGNGNSYLLDATTGKINRLTYKPFDLSFYKSPRQVSYTPSGYTYSSTNDYGNRRLFTKTEFSGKRAIYRQTRNEPLQRIQDSAELLTAIWSSDDKYVVYTWNDSAGKRHVSILVWESGYSYTAPFQLPTSDGYPYWSRGNKSVVYAAKELSIIIDLTHPVFGIDPARPTFRIVPRMEKLPLSKSGLFVSPTGQKIIFMSAENTWTVETIDGNTSRNYIVDAAVDPAHAMWSPDERYMVFATDYINPTGLGPTPNSSYTFLDLETAQTQSIPVFSVYYPKFLDDGHTALIVGAINFNIEIIRYDLLTQTKTTLFDGERELIGDAYSSVWFFDSSVFFVAGKRNETLKSLYRVDLKDGGLHLLQKDLVREQYTIGRSLNHMIVARQQDGKNIFSVFDVQGLQPVFTHEMPGKVVGINGTTWEGEWTIINVSRDGKRSGFFLEANTHQIVALGEGALRSASGVGFHSASTRTVLVRQLSDDMFEYTFFDWSIVPWGPYLLPKVQFGTEMDMIITRDQKNALVQFRTDKAYSVWVAETDGIRPRKLLEIPLSVKGNNASWALDEQHILIVTYKMASHDHSEMTLFDIDGKPLWTQSFDGIIYNPPEAIAC